jgi:outer membrane biogenesis lipoprotein LolB
MKRLLISSLLIFFLLPGCASLQTKREVVANTLYSSSNPKIQVKVIPEFEYLGEMKDTSERQAVDSTTMLINRADW